MVLKKFVERSPVPGTADSWMQVLAQCIIHFNEVSCKREVVFLSCISLHRTKTDERIHKILQFFCCKSKNLILHLSSEWQHLNEVLVKLVECCSGSERGKKPPAILGKCLTAPTPLLATSLTGLLCFVGAVGQCQQGKGSRGKEKWRKEIGVEQGGEECACTRELPTWADLQQEVIRCKCQKINQRRWG